MPHFFIDRPVFAWVVALFILLAGALAIPQLPVAQYPDVAPPQIEIYAVYPGASAQTVDESVVSLIEEELNGADHLLYFESQSSLGSATIKATFKPGTNPELAQVASLKPPILTIQNYIAFSRGKKTDDLAPRFAAALSDYKSSPDYAALLQRYQLER